MNADTSSIEALPEVLQEVFEHLKTNAEDAVQFAYGADDVLVVISESEDASPSFQKAVGDAIVDGASRQCGFVLDDGPEGYEEFTTAFIRAEPVNAYEYVLPYCAALEADASEAARVFGTIYSKTGDEGPDDAPRVAAAYIYLLLPDYEDSNYLQKLADLADTTPDDLRAAIVDAQQTL